MNRRYPWPAWAGLSAYLLVMLYLWAAFPSAPSWSVVAGLGTALGSVLVIEARHRRAPPADLAELGGWNSGAMAPASKDGLRGHDHGGPGTCPACLVTIAMLASMGEAVGAAERVADTGDIWDAQLLAEATAAMDRANTDAAEYLAGMEAQHAADLAELGAPFDPPPCGVQSGAHRCTVRPLFGYPHLIHICPCGSVWGRPE